MHAHRIRPAPFPSVALPRAPVSILAALALIAAAILWGTSFVAAKVVLADLPPVAVAFLRFAIAAVVLVPIACRGGRRPALGVQPALLGLTGVTLFFLCQNAGLRQASAAHATLILGGGLPVLTALLAACCLDERPTRRQLIGLACSLMGVIAVAGADGGAAGSSLWGDGPSPVPTRLGSSPGAPSGEPSSSPRRRSPRQRSSGRRGPPAMPCCCSSTSVSGARHSPLPSGPTGCAT
jgi:uncharacterized membrane protein